MTVRASQRFVSPATQTLFKSLPDFLAADSYKNGVLTIQHGGIPIDIKFDGRGHDTTTIFFHAALSSGTAKFPIFAGQLMSEDLPTNRIHVSDPTMLIDDNLMLGWYAGNHRQPKLQTTLRFILGALIPPDQRVVTFGASGGGFASLYYAGRFDGATAIAVNPQTNIARYIPQAVDRYTQLGWKVRGTNKIGTVPAITNLVWRYKRPVPNRAFYVQNLNDTFHMANHYSPFIDAVHAENEVHSLMFDGKKGHQPPSPEFMRGVLEAAISGGPAPTSLTLPAT
ncbi:hypothetical protein [Agrococcus casei]|uniref:hypothetical protein n=1 Tax=Agrococcus casei TaxID=343512 RepID=UPI000B35DA94|nr:hypothetical protein [Agrococcus casei]